MGEAATMLLGFPLLHGSLQLALLCAEVVRASILRVLCGVESGAAWAHGHMSFLPPAFAAGKAKS